LIAHKFSRLDEFFHLVFIEIPSVAIVVIHFNEPMYATAK